MKNSYLIIIALLGLTFSSFRCRTEPPELPYQAPVYEFKEKLTLTPYKKTYAINDTIWVQFQTLDKTLFDKLSGNRIATDTTSLGATMYINKRYPSTNVSEFYAEVKVDSATDISFQPLYTWYNVLKFTTACSSNRYIFRIGYRLLKPGIYSIEPQAILSPCPGKNYIDYPYKFQFNFDLADCNKDVWLTIPAGQRDERPHGFTDARIDNKEIFVYKVE